MPSHGLLSDCVIASVKRTLLGSFLEISVHALSVILDPNALASSLHAVCSPCALLGRLVIVVIPAVLGRLEIGGVPVRAVLAANLSICCSMADSLPSIPRWQSLLPSQQLRRSPTAMSAL